MEPSLASLRRLERPSISTHLGMDRWVLREDLERNELFPDIDSRQLRCELCVACGEFSTTQPNYGHLKITLRLQTVPKHY